MNMTMMMNWQRWIQRNSSCNDENRNEAKKNHQNCLCLVNEWFVCICSSMKRTILHADEPIEPFSIFVHFFFYQKNPNEPITWNNGRSTRKLKSEWMKYSNRSIEWKIEISRLNFHQKNGLRISFWYELYRIRDDVLSEQ